MSDWKYIQCLGYFYIGKVGDPKKNEAAECIANRWAGEIQGGWEVLAGDLREKTSPLANSSFPRESNSLFLLVEVTEP